MERKGSTCYFKRGEAFEFNSFKGEMNLIDVLAVGTKFTGTSLMEEL